MILILARIIVSIALFCVPFFLIIALSSGLNSGMILIIPLVGGVPAIIAALLFFWPIEGLLDKLGVGWLKNIAVPLAGCAIVFIFMLIASMTFADMNVILRNASRDPEGLLVWSVFGGAWGLVWRMTEWIAKKTGLARA